MAAMVAAQCLGRPAVAAIRYEARITGVKNSALADLLAQVSRLKSLEGRLPATREALRRRAEGDLARLVEAADSLGYWDAKFSYRIDFSAKPVRVTVTAVPGPRYHVAKVSVEGPQGRPLAVPQPKGAPPLPLKPGDPADTAPVVATEEALLARLQDLGHPFAKAVARRVVIDKATNAMLVTYRLDPGPVMRFGRLRIEGLKGLDQGYVARRVRWHEGAPYDARLVERTRRALIATGLFSTVAITPQRDHAQPGTALMTIAVTERAPHTVGAGIAYNTSEGAAARVFWEDRNLLGNGEDLGLAADYGQQVADVTAKFRRPDLLARDQDFLATGQIADETPVAYHSRRASVSAGLERRFGRFLTGGAALSVEKANVVQLANLSLITASERTQHYALVGVPLYLKYDSTNNLLNPTRGYRAQFATTPYQSISGRNLTFVSSWASASTYRPIGAGDRVVFAARIALASIEGAPTLLDIPADKRIYAGGGASIRAYGYEMAGPLDRFGKPIGGKSSLAVNLEFRIRITNRIGIVPFIDAGSYYEKPVPQLGERLLWGPGIGLRYYTPFGPIRLDIATPLNRRPGDSPIQFYISLGQAF